MCIAPSALRRGGCSAMVRAMSNRMVTSRTRLVAVRWPLDLLARVDAMRGTMPQSQALIGLVSDALGAIQIVAHTSRIVAIAREAQDE